MTMEIETTKVMIHTTSPVSNLLYITEHEHNCMKGYPDQKQIMFSEQLTFILASIHFILVAAETKERKQKEYFIKISNWKAKKRK